MRFAIALLVAGAVSVSANDFSKRQNVPQCALTCIAQGPAGSCSQSDVACLCTNSNFVSSVEQCITSTCDPTDITAAAAFASQTCAQAGVSLSDTGSASATESASAPSASATEPSSTHPASGTPSASGSAPPPTSSSAAGQNGVSAFAAFAAALGLSFFAL